MAAAESRRTGLAIVDERSSDRMTLTSAATPKTRMIASRSAWTILSMSPAWVGGGAPRTARKRCTERQPKRSARPSRSRAPRRRARRSGRSSPPDRSSRCRRAAPCRAAGRPAAAALNQVPNSSARLGLSDRPAAGRNEAPVRRYRGGANRAAVGIGIEEASARARRRDQSSQRPGATRS